MDSREGIFALKRRGIRLSIPLYGFGGSDPETGQGLAEVTFNSIVWILLRLKSLK